MGECVREELGDSHDRRKLLEFIQHDSEASLELVVVRAAAGEIFDVGEVTILLDMSTVPRWVDQDGQGSSLRWRNVRHVGIVRNCKSLP